MKDIFLRMVPQVGAGAKYLNWRSKLLSLSLGVTGVLLVLAVFRGYILRVLAVFRGSVLTADTAFTRGLVLHIYFHYSQYLSLQYCSLPVLAVFWPPVLPYCQCFEYEMYSILPSILGA